MGYYSELSIMEAERERAEREVELENEAKWQEESDRMEREYEEKREQEWEEDHGKI